MVNIAFATYPPDSSQEIGKRYMNLSPPLEFIRVKFDYSDLIYLFNSLSKRFSRSLKVKFL